MKLHVQAVGAEQVRTNLRALGKQMADRALAATAVEVEQFIEGEAAKHNVTGRLVRSIYKKRITEGWEIGHDPRVAPHAVFVHWGTRPHVIRPKRKKALRWPAGGKFVFAGVVNHPGYKGDPWLTRAAREAPIIFKKQVELFLARQTGA